MIFLATNPLITPQVGTIFWTILTFLLLLVVLRKYAWGPIMTGLKNREQSISDALAEAKHAREEMKNLRSQNEALLQEARADRDKILREARDTKDKIIGEAKNLAQEEGRRILQQAKESIEKEKQVAFRELKEQVVTIALDAATRILQKELADPQAQEEIIETYLQNVNGN
ncbi:MAG: F0F1 ATP synthase subunit B [Bacteroidota bacterium]|nr:F0F1 ATP synthase subunit B [Bacteroidota bacterium]